MNSLCLSALFALIATSQAGNVALPHAAIAYSSPLVSYNSAVTYNQPLPLTYQSSPVFASAPIIRAAPLAQVLPAKAAFIQQPAYIQPAPIARALPAPALLRAAPQPIVAEPVVKTFAQPIVAAEPVLRTPAQPIIAEAAPIISAKIEEADHYPQYKYAYGVQDALTGDSKTQEESRDGDVVRGSYSLIEPDGSRRTVKYYSDPINGFNAVVEKDVPVAPVSTGPAVIAAKQVVA